jgi:copper resistance protein C
MPDSSHPPAVGRGRSHRLRRVAATLAVGVTALVGSAVPASAHENLVRAVPGDGSTVTSAPARVQLVFDEKVGMPADIVVTGPTGERVEQGPVQVLDNTAGVRVDVRAAGRYTVAFRVVSADGHPVTGQTGFRFAPGGTARPGSAPPSTEHVGQGGHADHAEHTAGEDEPAGGLGRGPVIGIAAGAALLAGLALLTLRRRPGGIGSPGSPASRKDRA